MTTWPGSLLALGGVARSPVWLQLQSDALGLSLSRPAGAEVGPVLGAARLALLTLGMPAAKVLKAPEVAQQFHPCPDHQALLARRLERFRSAWDPCRLLGRPT